MASSSSATSAVNCGAITELEPPAANGDPWTQTTLYSFTGLNGDACGPIGTPALGSNGALYGVTSNGGAYSVGAVYALLPPRRPGGAWTEEVLYSFSAIVTDPLGAIGGPQGNIYVGTMSAGDNDTGAIFQLQPPKAPGEPWSTSVVYSFPGPWVRK